MKHLQTVLLWAGVSAAIILAGLYIHAQPPHVQGPMIAGTLFLVSAAFVWRICWKG